MLFALVVESFVHGVVRPDFFSLPMLKVISPLALIPCAVLVDVNAVTIGLVIEPLPLEDVAVDMPEFSVSAGLIEPPMALILCAIFPNLDSVSVFHIAEPLTCVSGPIFEVNFASLIELCFVNIVHVNIGHIIVLELFIYYLAVAIAHVVLMLRIHLA